MAIEIRQCDRKKLFSLAASELESNMETKSFLPSKTSLIETNLIDKDRTKTFAINQPWKRNYANLHLKL